MNGRLPRRPVERYGDHAGASGVNVAHAPGATVGSFVMVGATVGWPSHRAALPPVVHERYGGLALRAVVYGHNSDKNKI